MPFYGFLWSLVSYRPYAIWGNWSPYEKHFRWLICPSCGYWKWQEKCHAAPHWRP